MNLSVVVITKNQEFNIERLLISVVKGINSDDLCEIILVDSASTDKTVIHAMKYGIKIIKIASALRYTASAGRYIGALYSQGDYILFLDGDMELLPDWFHEAKRYIDTNEFGLVTGSWVNIYPDETGFKCKRDNELINPLGKRRSIGGAGLYSKKALFEVGSFNPCLFSDEEPSLFLRLKGAGYKHFRTDDPIVKHYEKCSPGLGWLSRRRSEKLWVGIGQNIRYFIGSKFLFPYILYRGFGLVIALWILIFLLVTVIALLIRLPIILTMFLAFSLLILIFDIGRRKSFKETCYSLLQRLLILEATIKGLFTLPVAPNLYWANLDIIESCSERGYERFKSSRP